MRVPDTRDPIGRPADELPACPRDFEPGMFSKRALSDDKKQASSYSCVSSRITQPAGKSVEGRRGRAAESVFEQRGGRAMSGHPPFPPSGALPPFDGRAEAVREGARLSRTARSPGLQNPRPSGDPEIRRLA